MCLLKYSHSWRETWEMGKLSSICVKEPSPPPGKASVHVSESIIITSRHEHTATKWKIIAANMPILGTCSISQTVSWKTLSLNCLKRINTDWINQYSLRLHRQSWGGLLSKVPIRPKEHFRRGLFTFPLTKLNSHFIQTDKSWSLSFLGLATTWSWWSISFSVSWETAQMPVCSVFVFW